MINTSGVSLEQVQIKQMNCYFSEICEVSGIQTASLRENEPLNCHVSFNSDSLLIVTAGGNKFYLPLDQQISRVFPMVEGILIEFFVKAESKLQEILYYQKNKTNIDIEENESEGKYCYASLTRHPLNHIKILGELSSNNLNPWYKSREKVTCVSLGLPLLFTYNEELSRNAIHLLTANLSEIESEYQFAYIPTQTYSLKSIAEYPHYEVVASTIYESNHTEPEITSVHITKSSRKNLIYVYAHTRVNTVRIFEIDLNNHKDLVHELSEIPQCYSISTSELYPSNMFKPALISKGQSHIEIEIVNNLVEEFNDLAVILQNQDICFYHRNKEVWRESVSGSNAFSIENGKVINQDGSIARVIGSFCDRQCDGIIIRALELTLDEHDNFAVFLNRYKAGQHILSILEDMEAVKLPIIQILHTLCEELRLYETANKERVEISDLVLELSKTCKKYDYVEYYLRHHQASKNIKDLSIPENVQPVEEVLDIFGNLNEMILKSNVGKQNIVCLFNRTSFIFNFLSILIHGDTHVNIESFSKHLHQAQTKDHYLRAYPLLTQKVFHIGYFNAVKEEEKLKQIQPDSKEQKAFIYLIQNNHNHSEILSYPQSIRAIFYWLLREMRRNLQFKLYEDIPELGFTLIHREDLYKNIQMHKKKKSIVPFYLKKPLFEEHIKTLVHTSTSEEYFLTSNASEMNKINNDLVFEEVDRLLSSSSEIKVKARDIESIPEHKWESESQNILLKFANRKVSVLVGQGAFSLGTSRSFLTDIIKITKINLNGIMPNDVKITLDLKDDKEAIIHWPEFHSGMAAGLKLSRHVIPLSEDHLKTWIFYQKPDTPRRDHSGFLLSLGLLGYLKCFSPTDIYQYLKPNNEFTSVAILLGVSASSIGKSEENLSKTLVLHIPSLLPPNVDLEIPINVQTSALIGIGLLHKGTCNRTMTEMTLSQIGKKPCTDKCLDREGYSLAAGWALGMICLGMKDTKENFRDLQLEERLIRFIEGGKVMDPPQSMMSTNFVNESKCSSIKEGPNVNLHITAPAALLAISLMYLKSNNYELANKISIPNSFNTIEECNPNHILLKTVAKNLILWDSIGNTKESMMKQIPELIRFIFQNSLKQVHEQYYLIYNVSEIDYQTITTIYASVLTGCAISMGLKYAGTGDKEAVNSIKWHIEQLKSIRIIKCEFANDPLNKNCIDQYELFSLISVSVLALSLIMAGTCDIECLKLIRIIRKKFQDSKVFHYGFSMALNMAIGFIFLGYGNYTFNRQDMSIASLLITIFPQFPNSSVDNKWHLQALRHFYVLAMEEKIFHAVDVDTNKVVAINVEMEFLLHQNQSVVKESLHTPILLQESKKLLHIKIKDEDYFDVDFSFVNSVTNPKAIYIKRKYFKDISPELLNPNNVMSTQRMKNDIIQSLNQEIRYTALFDIEEKEPDLSYLLGSHGVKKKTTHAIKSMKSLAVNQVLEEKEIEKETYYKLLKEDKLEMYEIYMNLKRQLRELVEYGIYHSNISSNISIMLSFEKWAGCLNFEHLIHREIGMVSDVLHFIFERLISREGEEEFIRYLNDPFKLNALSRDLRLYKYLSLKNVPSARNLKLIKQALQKMQGHNPEEIEFLLYVAFPGCDFKILKFIAKTLG